MAQLAQRLEDKTQAVEQNTNDSIQKEYKKALEAFKLSTEPNLALLRQKQESLETKFKDQGTKQIQKQLQSLKTSLETLQFASKSKELEFLNVVNDFRDANRTHQELSANELKKIQERMNTLDQWVNSTKNSQNYKSRDNKRKENGDKENKNAELDKEQQSSCSVRKQKTSTPVFKL